MLNNMLLVQALTALSIWAVGARNVDGRRARIFEKCWVEVDVCHIGELSSINIGPDYWPRLLPNVECNNVTCDRHQPKCHGVPYSIPVLKKKSSRELMDQNLPDSLSLNWTLANYTINVACACSFHDQYSKFFSMDNHNKI